MTSEHLTGAPLWTSADAARATRGQCPAAWTCTGIASDSRHVAEGDLFVALAGPNFDGHDFVADALAAGAVAATLPLIALNFGRVSAVAPLSNLLLVPAFALILGASALTAAAGAIWTPLGQVTGWFAWASLTYMIELAHFFAGLPCHLTPTAVSA